VSSSGASERSSVGWGAARDGRRGAGRWRRDPSVTPRVYPHGPIGIARGRSRSHGSPGARARPSPSSASIPLARRATRGVSDGRRRPRSCSRTRAMTASIASRTALGCRSCHRPSRGCRRGGLHPKASAWATRSPTRRPPPLPDDSGSVHDKKTKCRHHARKTAWPGTRDASGGRT
jgi:hypothetical protein